MSHSPLPRASAPRRLRPWLACGLGLGLLGSASALGACGSSDAAPPATTSASSSGGGSGGSACTFDAGTVTEPPVPPLHTPRWAFEPWISKDISTGPDTYDFVDGFKSRDIPVGAVVLDSPWETNYNTFIPNETRYPKFEAMVADMHAHGVRTVLWVTAFVNSSSFDLEMGGDSYAGASPNLAEGLACDFFVEDGQTYNWWKGKGASVDFMNPAARAWWHKQEDAVLAQGIDGFKLDFGDSYVPADPVKTKLGPVPHQTYSEAYYRDFYVHGVTNRGPEFVTMTRGWDKSYGFEGRFYARPEHAPVVWMGDNRRDYVGMADALDEMFRSAKAGYVVLGSDIGGYLDRDDKDLTKLIPLDPVVFARWTALGGLSPFMQLHGRANLTPWTVPQSNDQITNVYRYYAKLHHALVPFLYSLSEAAHAGGAGIVRPIGDEASWAGDYRFALGDALLVAPVLDASGKRDVALPAGASFYDWWAPLKVAANGGTTLTAYDATDLARIPLFVRAGAIVPMNIEDDGLGLGTATSKNRLTVLVYPDAPSSFDLVDIDEKKTQITAQSLAAGIDVTLTRTLRETLLRIRADVPPAKVSVDGVDATDVMTRAALDGASSGWFLEQETRSIWVKLPPAPTGHAVHAL